MKNIVIEIFGSKPEQNAVETCAKAFAAYSLYGWIEVWFPRGMQESADELTERRIRSKREMVSVWVNCLTKVLHGWFRPPAHYSHKTRKRNVPHKDARQILY